MCNFLHISLPAPRILRWPIYIFGKFVHHWPKILRKNSSSFRSHFSPRNNSTGTQRAYKLLSFAVINPRSVFRPCFRTFGLLRSGTRAAVNLPVVTLLDTQHISWDVRNSVETSFKTPVFHNWLGCLYKSVDLLMYLVAFSVQNLSKAKDLINSCCVEGIHIDDQ